MSGLGSKRECTARMSEVTSAVRLAGNSLTGLDSRETVANSRSSLF
jgi:hypothetical protein